MKIKIICISDSDKHFDTAIGEYIKRLPKQIEIIKIKPTKVGNRNQIIEKETQNVIKKLQKDNNYKVLLSIEGKKLNTMYFKDIINKRLNITYIIGGPFGLNEKMLEEYINEKISFSDMTFPHPLALLILIEQIYRSKTIIEGKQYHY